MESEESDHTRNSVQHHPCFTARGSGETEAHEGSISQAMTMRKPTVGRWRSAWMTAIVVLAIWKVEAVSSSSTPTPSSSASSSASASKSNGNGMILRIRLSNGSMEKVQIKAGTEEETTLEQVLTQFVHASATPSSLVVQANGKAVESTGASVAALGLKHGSIITVASADDDSSKAKGQPKESRFAKALHHDPNIWNPFPDLAKNYEHALLQTKTKRSSQKGMSYSAIAKLRSSLHTVEPQPEGPLKRVYMCQQAAERFQANGITNTPAAKGKKRSIITPRFGLLLGTIQRERVDMGRPRKARTSLSSQTSDSEYCTIAKVQCVWEPSGQQQAAAAGKGKKDAGMYYDCAKAETMMQSDQGKRALKVADRLGLVPVGWIFSYTEDRSQDDDALPVFGADVRTGSMLQIDNMKRRVSTAQPGATKQQQRKEEDQQRLDGAKFITLAMDAKVGATEAFQLSDVSVQMVAEGMFKDTDGLKQRHVEARHEMVIDGQESTKLDSVLCLINTAMLSHTGTFSSPAKVSTVKKNGGLMAKRKKAIVTALESKDEKELLAQLCDFNVLLALDVSLSDDDSKALCATVKKWARGQKSGTAVSESLKMKLRNVLDG